MIDVLRYVPFWFTALVVFALVPGNATPTPDETAPAFKTHGYGMERIEPGETWIGSPADEVDRDEDELRHLVQITNAYLMGKTEVTQALYEKVTGKNTSQFPGNSRPAERVSWYDAINFCNKLSTMDGYEPAYQISRKRVTWNRESEGYRLPTEAEWEHAARGGAQHLYSGSDDWKEVGWLGEGWEPGHHLVGSKTPNGYGLYDMTGNVWEWVWDHFGFYAVEDTTDPMGAAAGTLRVFRGGSWNSSPSVGRVARRGWGEPEDNTGILGFRIARTLKDDPSDGLEGETP